MTRLKIKPKSYQTIIDYTVEYFKDQEITREEIEQVVQFEYDFIREFLKAPVKGRLYIEGLGTFTLKVNKVIRFLRLAIEKMRTAKERGNAYNKDLVYYFRHWWDLRIMAVQFASDQKRKIKGFYKPIDIIKNIPIPKKKTTGK